MVEEEGPKKAQEQLLKVARAHPEIFHALNISRSADDRTLALALKRQTSNAFEIMKRAGCSLSVALEVRELLQVAAEAPLPPPYFEPKTSWTTKLIIFACLAATLLLLLILIGVLSVAFADSGWEAGVCSITAYKNFTCEQPDNECKFEVKINKRDTTTYYVVVDWTMPFDYSYTTGRQQSSVVGEGLKCCNDMSGVVGRCCDLYDAETLDFCDNWHGRPAPNGDVCTSNGWNCLFKVDTLSEMDGFASEMKPYSPPNLNFIYYPAGILVVCLIVSACCWLGQKLRICELHNSSEDQSQDAWSSIDEAGTLMTIDSLQAKHPGKTYQELVAMSTRQMTSWRAAKALDIAKQPKDSDDTVGVNEELPQFITIEVREGSSRRPSHDTTASAQSRSRRPSHDTTASAQSYGPATVNKGKVVERRKSEDSAPSQAGTSGPTISRKPKTSGAKSLVKRPSVDSNDSAKSTARSSSKGSDRSFASRKSNASKRSRPSSKKVKESLSEGGSASAEPELAGLKLPGVVESDEDRTAPDCIPKYIAWTALDKASDEICETDLHPAFRKGDISDIAKKAVQMQPSLTPSSEKKSRTRSNSFRSSCGN